MKRRFADDSAAATTQRKDKTGASTPSQPSNTTNQHEPSSTPAHRLLTGDLSLEDGVRPVQCPWRLQATISLA